MDNRNEPATKAGLAAVKQDVAEVKQDLAMLRAEVHHQYDDIKETLRDNETKLLKAFYTFAESNQARLASIETESDAVKKRVGLIEERLLQLERKVNSPNHPQR